VAIKLIQQGRIPRNESIVISITGNGLKTLEAVQGDLTYPEVIEAKLSEFDAMLHRQHGQQKPPIRAARPEVSVV
jgi:threonine synthase